MPELKKVIVGAGVGGDSTVVMKDTLAEALMRAVQASPGSTRRSKVSPTTPGGSVAAAVDHDDDLAALDGREHQQHVVDLDHAGARHTERRESRRSIDQANDDLTQAEAARKTGDLATYQQKVTEAAAEASQATSTCRTRRARPPPPPRPPAPSRRTRRDSRSGAATGHR